MTTASIPQLRPLGMGQLLDQAIRLYRRNFLKFVGIIAIVQIPLGLLQLGSSLLTVSGISDFPTGPGTAPPSSPFELFGPGYVVGLIGSVLIAILSFVLIQGVATAAMTQAVANSYLGESIGILDAYQKIGRVWLPLIGALLFGLVILVGIGLWTVVPCVGWLTGVGMLAFFAMVIMPLIAPIIVLEKQKATQSIRRAWDLARRRFWWVVGFVLILAIFAQIIITGPTLLITSAFGFIFGTNPLIPSSSEAIMIQTTVQSVVQIVGALIYYPLQLTAITLMYFDLRIRTEGFDLTLLSESVSDTPTEVAEITTQAPRPEKGNWITMTEMGYFVLIQLGAVALYFIIVVIFGAIAFAFLSAAGV